MKVACAVLTIVLAALGVFPLTVVSPSLFADDRPNTAISFSQTVRPILSDNCFACHGPDEKDRQAELRLDIPGDVDWDRLVERIQSTDPDQVMPPRESNKRLSPEQIDTVRNWIREGAVYQQHWAFVAPNRTPPPQVDRSDRSANEIDRYVLDKLRSRSWEPSPAADKRTLIRRVTMDLTGLPPTIEQIHAFIHDDSAEAYEHLVDRLLDSPHYGEHMAKYWLDLVRFADTNGLHHDHYREMTPYRDWVIRAFNENLPYDKFTIAQIAGDLYPQPTTDQLIASGFNRLHLIIDRGTALPEESFTRNVVDRVSAVGTAFMGLTLECAVCHDHKFDPITQRDFYQLFAYFNNFDGEPETGGRQGLDFRRGLQPPYLELPTDSQRRALSEWNDQIAAVQSQIRSLSDIAPDVAIAADVAADVAADQPAQSGDTSSSDDTDATELAAALLRAKEQLARLESGRDRLIESIPATLVMKERSEPRPAHILVRGNYDQLGEQVSRGTPAFLPAMKTIGSDSSLPENSPRVSTRMDFANWLVDPQNPLTARVAVNRFWQQVFGVGIVKTAEDFGAQGQAPSHPELLDHLTIEFINSGWNVKSLMRRMVLSNTYQQRSAASSEQFAADPQNRWLARGSRYRYDSEVIRDQVLAVSGLLNPTLYGKSVKPPQPEGLWKIVSMPNSYPRVFEADEGDRIYRRSVYSFWKRGLPPPQMTIFDAPTRESCSARRERTNTPLQSLVLMNEQHYFDAATALAVDLLSQPDLSDPQRIRTAYERITSQIPDPTAMSLMTTALDQFRRDYSDDIDSALQIYRKSKPGQIDIDHDQVATNTDFNSEDAIELASLTMLVHSLLNLDATKTRE